MFQFCSQQMTDLNRKPYTIQMIQNDITLGKEEGSREISQSDSFSADIFYRKNLIHKLTMPSAESWRVFQVCPENPSILLGVWRSQERSKTSHLSLSPSLWRESLLCILMPCYMLWIKRFPIREMRTRSLLLNQSQLLSLKRELSCGFLGPLHQ